ncbi:hypothetical protein IscW_ISCW011002, partial [Ixodes scapularis]
KKQVRRRITQDGRGETGERTWRNELKGGRGCGGMKGVEESNQGGEARIPGMDGQKGMRSSS